MLGPPDLSPEGRQARRDMLAVEDLLKRTVFYKVSHHLSYNGTTLEKGLLMVNSPQLATMATPDRNRISSQWKSTMPNHALLGELAKRYQGKCFVMNEKEIGPSPSGVPYPALLGADMYHAQPHPNPAKGTLYKEYTVRL